MIFHIIENDTVLINVKGDRGRRKEEKERKGKRERGRQRGRMDR